MTVDHIGYAVKNIEKAEKQMKALGYSFEPTVDDADRNVYIAFGSLAGYRIELVAPGSQEGGVSSRLHTIKIGSDTLSYLL